MLASGREKRQLTEPTRLALEYALELVQPSARAVVLDFMEQKCALSLYNDFGELGRDEVESALWAFFDSGAVMFMVRYDDYLNKLAKPPKHTYYK